MHVMINRSGKSSAKQKPLSKNDKKPKKPKPWDDSINDLSVHKMSTDAIARRRAIRHQQRGIESRSSVPSTTKEISWTKALNYEEQQEQMLREMFANKGRLWSVLKNDDRANSVTPMSRRESRRPVSSLFSAKARIITSRSLPPDMRHRSPPRKTFPFNAVSARSQRFRGLPNITSAPCSAQPPRSGRLLAPVDAGTGTGAGDDLAVARENRTPPSTDDRSDRKHVLTDQEFSNDEEEEYPEVQDLGFGDEVQAKPVNDPLPEPEVALPEVKPVRSRIDDLSSICLSGDKNWPPNPVTSRRPLDFIRSDIHRSLTGVKEHSTEKTTWTGPTFTGIGGALSADEVDHENINMNHMNEKQLRLLRRIDIQPVNEETISEEADDVVDKLKAAEESRKKELEESKKLVDALTLEVMTTNRRYEDLFEEFSTFKEKTEKEVSALQEAVTLLATHLRLKPVVQQTERITNEMSIEIQGHVCEHASSTTDETDNSDNFYALFESGNDMHGAFVDRNSIVDKLQVVQRLERLHVTVDSFDDK